ncbi:unnamed protein product [Chrysoparadoxa australica]
MEKARQQLRKGKWSEQESEFTGKMIEYFGRGLLRLPEGTTLRTYLARKLNCDPMRISKKYAGSQCLGKRVYQSLNSPMASQAEVARAAKELEELEAKYLAGLPEPMGSTYPEAERHHQQLHPMPGVPVGFPMHGYMPAQMAPPMLQPPGVIHMGVPIYGMYPQHPEHRPGLLHYPPQHQAHLQHMQHAQHQAQYAGHPQARSGAYPAAPQPAYLYHPGCMPGGRPRAEMVANGGYTEMHHRQRHLRQNPGMLQPTDKVEGHESEHGEEARKNPDDALSISQSRSNTSTPEVASQDVTERKPPQPEACGRGSLPLNKRSIKTEKAALARRPSKEDVKLLQECVANLRKGSPSSYDRFSFDKDGRELPTPATTEVPKGGSGSGGSEGDSEGGSCCGESELGSDDYEGKRPLVVPSGASDGAAPPETAHSVGATQRVTQGSCSGSSSQQASTISSNGSTADVETNSGGDFSSDSNSEKAAQEARLAKSIRRGDVGMYREYGAVDNYLNEQNREIFHKRASGEPEAYDDRPKKCLKVEK